MVVHSCPEERDLVLGRDISRRQSAQLAEDLLLGEPLVEIQRPAEPKRFGDVGEQVLDRADTDCLEHLAQIVIRDRRVTAHTVSYPRVA